MIAIIPARGGSKGIPRKNVKTLGGIPLIAHTINAAKESECIDEIIVTTDDEEIASVAREYGASVPFMRPDYLAQDGSLAVDVYIHAVEWLNEHREKKIEKFMVLLPTTPFRTSNSIDGAYGFFINHGASTLIAVKEAPIPPGWYMKMDDKNVLNNCRFECGKEVQNRQNSSKYYIPCGAIYILDFELLKTKRTYYCDNTVGYLLSNKEAVDIDSIEDFEYAEYCYGKSTKEQSICGWNSDRQYTGA